MRALAFAVAPLVAAVLIMAPRVGATSDHPVAVSAMSSASNQTAQTRSPCNADDPPPWCKKAGSSGRT
jgi:hypothetical protein